MNTHSYPSCQEIAWIHCHLEKSKGGGPQKSSRYNFGDIKKPSSVSLNEDGSWTTMSIYKKYYASLDYTTNRRFLFLFYIFGATIFIVAIWAVVARSR